MNRLFAALNSISNENEIRAKAKIQKEKHIKNIAWKALCDNRISAFDYVRICNKNNQTTF